MKENNVKRGVFWSALERFSVQGTQFLMTIVISRFVLPEEYGLVAMISIFIALANSLIDCGFTTALIQKQDRTNIDFSTVLVRVAIKYVVEKILMERIVDNQYYQARACGNHIDITEFAPDQSVLTTSGTGLISFIRHLITNDTQLGNDLITVTLSYNGNQAVMTESGSDSDNPSTVSVQMLQFFRQITGITSGDIKQSDLFGMIIDMAVTLDNVTVNYKIAIKNA